MKPSGRRVLLCCAGLPTASARAKNGFSQFNLCSTRPLMHQLIRRPASRPHRQCVDGLTLPPPPR